MADGDKQLFNALKHSEWTPIHSLEWYSRLAEEVEVYQYPWKSEFDEPRAETMAKHASSRGLKVINYYYVVSGVAK
jgi:ubiquinone/menaquinone biosynthesis C-methylase UbiE